MTFFEVVVIVAVVLCIVLPAMFTWAVTDHTHTKGIRARVFIATLMMETIGIALGYLIVVSHTIDNGSFTKPTVTEAGFELVDYKSK